jgi:hypothetical protein
MCLATAGCVLARSAARAIDITPPPLPTPVAQRDYDVDDARTASHGARWRERDDVESLCHRGTTPRAVIALLSAISILMLCFLWRRPGAAGKYVEDRSFNEVVGVSCSRCSRVVDVRRDQLSRQLYCPRCGNRLMRRGG